MHCDAVEDMLPDWLRSGDFTGRRYADDAAKMDLVIEWSRRNVEEATGGPFGAAVFDMATGRLVGAGVNVVAPSNLSAAHAEIMALSAAQRRLQSYDLGLRGNYELVTSTEPCAMCFGALPWSGIRRVVCGATSADACAIGFDEGPRHPDWIAELERRGIEVITEVRRDEARAVLDAYADGGGLIYNGSGGGLPG